MQISVSTNIFSRRLNTRESAILKKIQKWKDEGLVPPLVSACRLCPGATESRRQRQKMVGHAEIHQQQHREMHSTRKSYFLHVEEISSHACSSKQSSLHHCLFSLGKGLWCYANLLGVAKTNKLVAHKQRSPSHTQTLTGAAGGKLDSFTHPAF